LHFFSIVFPENEVEYEKVSKFSFIEFLKNGVEYGIVGKSSFIAFLKKRGGIIFSFFRVFSKERAKRHFLVSNVSADMLTEICLSFGNVFVFYVYVSISVFLYPTGP